MGNNKNKKSVVVTVAGRCWYCETYVKQLHDRSARRHVTLSLCTAPHKHPGRDARQGPCSGLVGGVSLSFPGPKAYGQGQRYSTTTSLVGGRGREGATPHVYRQSPVAVCAG